MCEIMPVLLAGSHRSSDGAGGLLLDHLELPEGGRAKYSALQGIIDGFLEKATDREKREFERRDQQGLLKAIFGQTKVWRISNSQEMLKVTVSEADEGMPEAWRSEAKKRRREEESAASLRTVTRRVDWVELGPAINHLQNMPRKMASPQVMVDAVVNLIQLRPGCHGPLAEEHGAAHAPAPPDASTPAAARPSGADSTRARTPQERSSAPAQHPPSAPIVASGGCGGRGGGRSPALGTVGRSPLLSSLGVDSNRGGRAGESLGGGSGPALPPESRKSPPVELPAGGISSEGAGEGHVGLEGAELDRGRDSSAMALDAPLRPALKPSSSVAGPGAAGGEAVIIFRGDVIFSNGGL